MMKRLLLKILFFAVLGYLLLLGIQYIIDAGLRKSRHEKFTEWNDIYQSKINADMIIMGSSRAVVHISPKILDSALELNSYNIGLDGWSFKMQNGRFRIYLQHNRKPKYIVQNVDVFLLTKPKQLYNYQQFLPYLNDTLIKQYTKGYEGEFTNFHYYLPLYKFNGCMEIAAEGLLSFFGVNRHKPVRYKGFEPMKKEWDGTFDEYKKMYPQGRPMPVDTSNKHEFFAFLDFCKKENIKVILVFTPELTEGQKYTTNRDEVVEMYQEFADKYGIPFLNYSNDSLSYRKDLFYNSQHLNDKGATLFSYKLAEDLKKIIKAR